MNMTEKVIQKAVLTGRKMENIKLDVSMCDRIRNSKINLAIFLEGKESKICFEVIFGDDRIFQK